VIAASGWLILLFLGTAVLSGLLVGWSYIPTPELAHPSIVDLESATLAGRTLRSLHFFSSHLCLAITLVHLLSVLMQPYWSRPLRRAAGPTGLSSRAQPFTRWISGLLCLVLLIALAFTGKVLPWDQHGGASLVVAEGLLATPVLGTATALKLHRVWLLHLSGTGLLLICLLAHVPLRARLSSWIRTPNKKTVAIIAGGALVAALVFSVLVSAPLGQPFSGRIEHGEVSAEWYLRWLQGLAVGSTDLARLVLLALLGLGLATPALQRRLGTRGSRFGDWGIRGMWLTVAAALSVISFLPQR